MNSTVASDMLLTPRWLDQPDFECFEAVTELNMPNAMMVQIAKVTYKGEYGYIVSAGNLFGSQTIMVPDADEALLALNVLQIQARKVDASPSKTLPLSIKKFPGWKLLPNKTDETQFDRMAEQTEQEMRNG